MKRRLPLAIAALLCCSALAAENNSIDRDFHARYLAWKHYISQPEVRVQSTAGARVNNAAFKALVDLGPAVIPSIVAKMEEDVEAAVLWRAIQKIAKVRIASTYDEANGKIIFPDYIGLEPTENVYLHWWREGRFKTGERFAELYRKWMSLKAENKDKEAEEIYRRIVDLGIPALPHLVGKVEQQTEFVPAVSKLSGGALAPTATAAECKVWWEKNRRNYELPTQSAPKKVSVAGKNPVTGLTPKAAELTPDPEKERR